MTPSSDPAAMNNSDAILQALHQLEHNFQEQYHQLEHNFQEQFHQLDYKLGKGLGDLEKGLKEQRQLIMALQRDSGGIVERQLQDAISRQFGGRYSKQLLARSIVDFSHLFPEDMFDRSANKAAGALAFIRPATQVGHIKHDVCKSALAALPPWHYCRPGGPCQA